jgi:hypothetical protein
MAGIMTKEENIEQLVSQLSDMGFHKPNMYSYLEDCWGMDVISHYQRERIGDDEMSYQVAIKRDGVSGFYYPEGYEAILLRTHPVHHGRFNDIDTQKLEQQLKEVNWNEYMPKNTRQDDKVFRVILEVVDLAVWQNKEAQDISRRLQLRYWLHTPVEQDLNVAQYISDYQKSYYFPLNNGFADIHAREAYNLLSGRGVLKFYQQENEPDNLCTHWKVIRGGKLATLSDFDFIKALRELPIEEINNDRTGPQLIYNLIRGERCTIHLNKDREKETGYIEVDPEKRSFKLYNANMTELNVDYYHLNDVQKQQYVKNNPAKITPAKKSKGKNKGRSL